MARSELKELSKEHRMVVCRLMHELQSVPRAHEFFYQHHAIEKPHEYAIGTFATYRASPQYRLDVYEVRATSLEDVKKIDFVQAIDRILSLVTIVVDIKERIAEKPPNREFSPLSAELRRVFLHLAEEADRCGIDDDQDAEIDPAKQFVRDLREAKESAKDDTEAMENFAKLEIPSVEG